MHKDPCGVYNLYHQPAYEYTYMHVSTGNGCTQDARTAPFPTQRRVLTKLFQPNFLHVHDLGRALVFVGPRQLRDQSERRNRLRSLRTVVPPEVETLLFQDTLRQVSRKLVLWPEVAHPCHARQLTQYNST